MAQAFTTAETVMLRVREELEDPDKTNYTDDELMGYLNEALQFVWAELAAGAPWFFDPTPYAKVQSVVLVGATANYALPADWYATRFVTVNGDRSELLARMQTEEEDAEGHMFVDGDTWVFPTPAAAGAMKVYYIVEFSWIEAIANGVPFVAEFGQVIKNYMVFKAKNRNSEAPEGTAEFLNTLRGALLRRAHAHNAPDDSGAKALWYSYL